MNAQARGAPPGMPAMQMPAMQMPMPGVGPADMQRLFQEFLQKQAQPRFQYEAGKVARPWGLQGPSVLRF
jgi:hypothetical protein